MDPIEIFTTCCDLISGLIDLIQAWKNRDEYLDSVKIYINSIGDTLRKYENDKKFITSQQKAYLGLRDELEDFTGYLKSQKKKNAIVKFFNGSSFVKECEEHIQSLQKWINTMSLDVAMHFGEKTATNFKDVFAVLSKMEEEREKSKCTFKNQFKNSNAAAFWLKYFENEQDVEWEDFSMNFNAFVYRSEKKQLHKVVLDEIAKILDSDGNKIVNFQEWDDFYNKIWCRFDHKAKFLLMCEKKEEEEELPLPQAKVEKKKSLSPLTLVYLETNEEDDDWETDAKPFDFPINQKFVIGLKSYKYKDLDNSLIEREKDILQNSLLLGRCSDPKIKNPPTIPDIAFSHKITTLSRKQFQITAKNLLNERGYFITDLSLVNPSGFRVRDMPYALNEGMVLDLNTYLFEVSEVFPVAPADESQKDYIFMPTDGRVSLDGLRNTLRKLKLKDYEEEDENSKIYEDATENTSPKKKKKGLSAVQGKNVQPYVKLRNMNTFLPRKDSEGMDNEKFLSLKQVENRIITAKNIERSGENITLSSANSDKTEIFSVGSYEDNKIIIKDKSIDGYYCQLYYDYKKQGWFVVEKHPLSKQEKYSAGTLIYLKSFEQYKSNKIGSIGYKLRNGMEIWCNSHVFGVELQE